MKRLNKINQAGFSLIEVITVLVIMGILSVGLSLGLIKSVEQYILASEANQLSQKAQVALARLKKELTEASTVTNKDATQIYYTRLYSPPSCQRALGCDYRIQNSGNQILLEGINPVVASQVLINNVATYTGSDVFLSFKDFSNADWNIETGNTVNNLAKINVLLLLNYGSGQTLRFNATINPRRGSKLNTPALN